jgi:hypothetical protein
MKKIVTYKVFEDESGSVVLTDGQKEFLNSYTEGAWELNPNTGLVDINGTFDCNGQDLPSLMGIRFGKVTGSFYCDSNQLTSLDGCPTETGKDFWCSFNDLSSLEGSPRKVGMMFYCSDNNLVSLEGGPVEVFGGYFCSSNNLTSLKGAPKGGVRRFTCEGNPVSEPVLKMIFDEMLDGPKEYEEAVRIKWEEIPLKDQSLLYRSEFSWVSDDDVRKLKAFANYKRIEGMI